MPEKKWTTISLPVALVEEIRAAAPSSGYRSIAEFVRDACRHRLEEMVRAAAPHGAAELEVEEAEV